MSIVSQTSLPIAPVTTVAPALLRDVGAKSEQATPSQPQAAPSQAQAPAVPASTAVPDAPQELAAAVAAAPSVSAALQAAAIQGGLAQLMADLVQAEQTPGLPAPVQAAIVQVLDFRSPIDAEPTPANLKEALSNSGLFSEANAAAEVRAADAGTQAPPAGTDMKTALLVLQQALKTWLAGKPETAPANDVAPESSRLGAANPPPPYRGGQPSGAKAPITPEFAAAVFQPADPDALAKITQAGITRSETQIPSSSSPESMMAAEATTELPPEFVTAEAAVNVPSATAASGPQLAPAQTTIPAPSETSPSQGPAQAQATPAPDDVRLEPARFSATAPSAPYRAPIGIPPEIASLPKAPSLPASDPQFAASAAQPGSAAPQGQAASTASSNTMAAAPQQGEPEGGGAANSGPQALPAQTDMKTALLVLQQVLKTSLAIAPAQPYALAAAKAAANGPARSAANSPPPPYRGAPTSAQRSLPSSLPANADARLVGEVLTKRTDAALAHMKLLQIASLPDAPQSTSTNQTPGSRWMFEIPFATPQGSTIAQFQISRDAGGGADDQAGPVWRARFSLDVEPIGPVHAQVALMGERAWVTLWAERETGVQSLRAKESLLSKSLKDSDFVAEIAFCLGTPHSRVAAAGQFLDSAS